MEDVLLMDVYLVQHAEAKPKEIDPEQPLTDDGRRAIEKVAGYVSKLNMAFGEIFHSGKLRSLQTARILAEHLGEREVKMREGIAPLDDVKPIVEWLREKESQGTRSMTIVGHLPFSDKLTSLLVAGNESANVVSFHRAGIVKLAAKSAGGGFAVDWILTPELLA